MAYGNHKSASKVRQLHAKGIGPLSIAVRLGISRKKVYAILKIHVNEESSVVDLFI